MCQREKSFTEVQHTKVRIIWVTIYYVNMNITIVVEGNMPGGLKRHQAPGHNTNRCSGNSVTEPWVRHQCLLYVSAGTLSQIVSLIAL